MFTVPSPSVTVTAPNTQTVGQSLTLECSVTAVRGITSRVDIIWSRDGMVLNRTNNTSPTMMDSALIYTDTYTISQLSTDDEGREYECAVVINASPVVTATGSVMLDVIGEFFIYLSFNIYDKVKWFVLCIYHKNAKKYQANVL